jgi:two-component system sensor histidine kinase/response regulator
MRPVEYLRVLLAEDNPVNRRLAKRLLEKRGHRVVLAVNGREAVEALEKESSDLVLMDLQMPEMDGLEAAVAIREKEKGSAFHQPIAALTAHAMKGDREICLAAGIDGYLTKPFRPKELDDLLENYVARRKEARNKSETPPSEDKQHENGPRKTHQGAQPETRADGHEVRQPEAGDARDERP